MEHTVTYLLMVQKFANLKQKILGAIAVDDILDICNYLMKKNDIKCLGLLKYVFLQD